MPNGFRGLRSVWGGCQDRTNHCDHNDANPYLRSPMKMTGRIPWCGNPKATQTREAGNAHPSCSPGIISYNITFCQILIQALYRSHAR